MRDTLLYILTPLSSITSVNTKIKFCKFHFKIERNDCMKHIFQRENDFWSYTFLRYRTFAL